MMVHNIGKIKNDHNVQLIKDTNMLKKVPMQKDRTKIFVGI